MVLPKARSAHSSGVVHVKTVHSACSKIMRPASIPRATNSRNGPRRIGHYVPTSVASFATGYDVASRREQRLIRQTSLSAEVLEDSEEQFSDTGNSCFCADRMSSIASITVFRGRYRTCSPCPRVPAESLAHVSMLGHEYLLAGRHTRGPNIDDMRTFQRSTESPPACRTLPPDKQTMRACRHSYTKSARSRLADRQRANGC